MRNIALTLAAAAAFGLAATAASAETVRIGTEGAYPPFNFIDENGELQGFDIDITRALCEAAEFECEFILQDWDGIIPGLLAEKYDAIVASMSITEERMQVVDFTNKYYQTPAKFVQRKGAGNSIADGLGVEDSVGNVDEISFDSESLDGKVVGVQSATIHEAFLQDNLDGVVEVRSYGSQEEANLDLVSGRLDMLLADSIVLDEGFLQTEGGADYEFVGPGFTDARWFGTGAGIAIRQEDDTLREAFNAAIDKIRADGTYQQINDQYFDFDVFGAE
ncbi:ABC transporter substrate-binding protein [Algihabitans albus]|uniref:ABC transporter substrate-binding protein n=1 Tax=Algihabitans albus TaxID=2164067 RepID=UPI000E5D0ACA|nr:ABC transporter substrate-binding protein [Algihabitans albus]